MIFSKKMFNRNDCIAVLLHCVAAQIDIKKKKRWIGTHAVRAQIRLFGLGLD